MTRTLLTFTEGIMGIKMIEVKNLSGETPKMVCEKFQFTSLIMMYDQGFNSIGSGVSGENNNGARKIGIKERFKEEDNSFEREPDEIVTDK